MYRSIENGMYSLTARVEPPCIVATISEGITTITTITETVVVEALNEMELVTVTDMT